MSRSLAVVLDAVLYIYCGSIKSPFCSSRFLLHPALPRPCPSLHGEYTAGPSVALHVAGAYSDRDRLRPPYPPPPSSSHPRIHSPFCDSPQLILAVHHPPSPAKTLHSPSTSYHDPLPPHLTLPRGAVSCKGAGGYHSPTIFPIIKGNLVTRLTKTQQRQK
jgi:hypothetical protein